MGGAKEGAEKVREEKYRKMRGKAVGGRDGRLRDRAQNRIRRLSGGGGAPGQRQLLLAAAEQKWRSTWKAQLAHSFIALLNPLLLSGLPFL